MKVHRVCLTALLLAACAGSVRSQALVESAVLTAATATAATGAGGVGKSTAGIFEGLRKILATPGAPGKAAPVTTVTIVTMAPEEPKPVEGKAYADPSGITVGLGREELLSKFGGPALKMAAADGSETWWYRPPDRDAATITMRDEKVAAVVLPSKRRPAAALRAPK